MDRTVEIWSRQWLIDEITDEGIVLRDERGNREHLIAAGQLPDDVERGDVFRLLAEVDRSGSDRIPDGWMAAVRLRQERHLDGSEQER